MTIAGMVQQLGSMKADLDFARGLGPSEAAALQQIILAARAVEESASHALGRIMIENTDFRDEVIARATNKRGADA